MAKFAERTNVSTDNSVVAIKAVLAKFGATRFGLLEDEHSFSIGFEMEGRSFRFTIPILGKDNFRVRRVGKNGRTSRTPAQIDEAWEQSKRERYRALYLAIKAKMVSVDSGIETLEQAFMAHLLLPNGKTMSEWADDQMDQLYAGKMPPLLGSGEYS